MAIPATGRFIGTPASISASELPHTVAIEDEPLDSVISDTRRMRVRKLLALRQHRMQRAPGELAMADLTASGCAHAPRFADRIRREIVVQHEVLFVRALQRVDVCSSSPVPKRRHD